MQIQIYIKHTISEPYCIYDAYYSFICIDRIFSPPLNQQMDGVVSNALRFFAQSLWHSSVNYRIANINRCEQLNRRSIHKSDQI